MERHDDNVIAIGDRDSMQGHDAHNHAHLHPMLPRYIEIVDFGNYELHTWYHSPLPPPFGTMRHLFVCPFTLKYFRKRKLLDAHIAAMPRANRHPPGYVQYTSPDPPPPEASGDDGTITAVCDPKVCCQHLGITPSLHVSCSAFCYLNKEL
jgi:histone acetyltransferase MYST1